MLTKLEEFCGLVDMVMLKQGNFHFIMKLTYFKIETKQFEKKGKQEKI